MLCYSIVKIWMTAERDEIEYVNDCPFRKLLIQHSGIILVDYCFAANFNLYFTSNIQFPNS